MFTSRLPTSTSVRRPKSMAESSNSFANSVNRHSNIPVSVKKANLFTPQTTKRPFAFGNSTAGKSFMSSAATTDRKSYISRPTSKPMPDKDQLIKMFDTLVQFLATNGFPHPLPDPKKFFSSISTTESTRLWEFLISQLLPEFRITRLEIDVPEALKTLNYPHVRAVTKSALISVTSRQAVIGLLTIFYWLVHHILILNKDDEIEPESDSDGPSIHGQILLNLLYMPREQAVEVNRIAIEKYFPTCDLGPYEDQLNQLRADIDLMKQGIQDIREVGDIRRVLKDDIIKCKKYKDDMKNYIEGKRQELRDAREEAEKTVKDLENIQEQLNLIEMSRLNDLTQEGCHAIIEEHNKLQEELESKKTIFYQNSLLMQKKYDDELKNQDQYHEREMTKYRSEKEQKKQKIKYLSEKYDNWDVSKNSLKLAKKKQLEKKRDEHLINTEDRIKSVNKFIENYQAHMDKIMEQLRSKASYIEELDRRSEEKCSRSRNIYKKLMLNISGCHLKK